MSRGGRRASLPPAAWEPPQRGVVPGGDGTLVRFLEESGEQSKAYDFSALEVEPELQQWMARCFSRRISTSRTPAKRLRTANNRFDSLRGFAQVLARHQPPPTCVAQLAEAHIRAFVEHYDGLPKRQHSAFKQLRTVLRNDPELPEDARQVLFNIRVKQPEVERPAPTRKPTGRRSRLQHAETSAWAGSGSRPVGGWWPDGAGAMAS
ncbi:hypothetical protein ABZV31_37370 [Streptomyces sp. NPDC005202]|uniref:hypothetical protein n=1 Tax=Streptomyces sp. NPDC005202 TaxID=3157021 RepID=UPI0033A75429